ncbi:unnamed protein product [Microthlaspi erraticum]|uniref:Uncharacterized protein n=1 Tax=Microthlaspi erraticum TaxID=1685480 RepID=A0A6D2J9I7_9BRAS|nr:unnamed protein product [Microthlaspi erraticum]
MEAWSDPKSPMWISFSNVVGLSIIGLGTINGGGSPFWEALHINKCDNLKINGITSIDSPRHHISINSCNGAAISQINLFAPEDSPNTDGIDLRDDCIAINTGSININITNINCGPGHGISVGSLGANGETATVSNVQVTHCTFNQTLNGARIKTWPGGQGYARNISFEDITLINSKNPIVIDQNYRDKGLLDGTEESAVAISSIKFIGFNGTTSSKNAIALNCSEITRCTDVIMDGIDISTSTGNGEKPTVECQYVDGTSSDLNLMQECFQNSTIA